MQMPGRLAMAVVSLLTSIVIARGDELPGALVPQGSPPLGLEGYCPVTLVKKREWKRGDAKWSAIHRNRTYQFAGPDEKAIFLKVPDIYSPVLSGDDPVSWVDAKKREPGRREHGCFFNSHFILFANEENLATFTRNHARYAEAFSSDEEVASAEQDPTSPSEPSESYDSPPRSLVIAVLIRCANQRMLLSILRRMVSRSHKSPFQAAGW
jgi:hypothetical protein